MCSAKASKTQRMWDCNRRRVVLTSDKVRVGLHPERAFHRPCYLAERRGVCGMAECDEQLLSFTR